MFLSSRLIMNSRQLWNLHQRHKFLRAEASRHILKFKVSEMAFAGVLKRYFPLRTPCCFVRIHIRLETMPQKIKLMFQVLHDITRFKRFTDLNLFKYAFHGIQNWERSALQLQFDGAYFLLQVMVEGHESSRLRMANQPAVLAKCKCSPCATQQIFRNEIHMHVINLFIYFNLYILLYI